MKLPLIIAHRGFHRDFPENTLEAFLAAVKLGVAGVEFDVHETSDGGFVIHHDPEIGGCAISDMGLGEVDKLRIGGIYRIPTLQDALEVLGQGMVLMLELKKVRSLARFLAVLRTRVAPLWTFLVSFDEQVISELALMAPEFRGTVIRMPGPHGKGEDGVFLQASCEHVTPGQVEQARLSGRLVFAWDDGSMQGLQRALDYGIDIVMTDRPDVVLGLLGRLTI